MSAADPSVHVRAGSVVDDCCATDLTALAPQATFIRRQSRQAFVYGFNGPYCRNCIGLPLSACALGTSTLASARLAPRTGMLAASLSASERARAHRARCAPARSSRVATPSLLRRSKVQSKIPGTCVHDNAGRRRHEPRRSRRWRLRDPGLESAFTSRLCPESRANSARTQRI